MQNVFLKLIYKQNKRIKNENYEQYVGQGGRSPRRRPSRIRR